MRAHRAQLLVFACLDGDIGRWNRVMTPALRQARSVVETGYPSPMIRRGRRRLSSRLGGVI